MDALTTCCSNRPGKGMSINPFGRNPDDPSIPANKNFITVGRGFGGVDELAASLDESKVMWGLIAQSVGSGSMARTKYVFLYFSGAKMSVVRKMRYTEKRPAAVEALGGGGMIDWDRENAADVHLDSLLEKVLSAVVADDANANMSVSSLRTAALDQIKKASEQVCVCPSSAARASVCLLYYASACVRIYRRSHRSPPLSPHTYIRRYSASSRRRNGGRQKGISGVAG